MWGANTAKSRPLVFVAALSRTGTSTGFSSTERLKGAEKRLRFVTGGTGWRQLLVRFCSQMGKTAAR
jgi:hypothetical protein